jgi:hypothetical protein
MKINSTKRRVRFSRTPIEFSQILKKEGTTIHRYAANLSEVHEASVFLFKQILPFNDPRWHLAQKYADLTKETNFQPVNLENSMRANYAARSKGRNKAFGQSITFTPQVRQLARGLKNIELGMQHVYRRPPLKYKQFSLVFERTRSIMKDADSRGVTGCPEALWQLQLWDGKEYLGRIGFNFHQEGKTKVVSIANIQGVAGKFRDTAKKELDALKVQEKDNFGEFLIKRLREQLGPDFEYRGVTPKNNNIVQYKMSFRKAKLPNYDTEIKTQRIDLRKVKE